MSTPLRRTSSSVGDSNHLSSLSWTQELLLLPCDSVGWDLEEDSIGRVTHFIGYGNHVFGDTRFKG